MLDRRITAWLGLVAFAAAACESSDTGNGLSMPSPEDQDGGGVLDPPTHSPESVKLGIGFRTFETVLDGSEVELVRGPQSLGRFFGYHIWLSVQEKGYLPDRTALDFRVFNVDTSTTVGDTAFVFDLRPNGDGYGAVGLRVLLPDCCLVERSRLRISLDLVDEDGHLGHDARSVLAGPCRTLEGQPLCP